MRGVFEEELRVVPGEEAGECLNDDMGSSMFEYMYVRRSFENGPIENGYNLLLQSIGVGRIQYPDGNTSRCIYVD